MMEISPIKFETPGNPRRFHDSDEGKISDSQGMDISGNFSPIHAMSTPASDNHTPSESDMVSSPSIILAPHASSSSARSSEFSHHATPTKLLFYGDHHYKTPTTRLIQNLKNNSPAFKTPSSGRSTYSGTRMMTPHTPSSSSLSTPGSSRQRKILNPFDSVDQLSQPMASPNMFATRASPSEESPGPFHWNIEHLAELFPVDIDEMPVYQMQKVDQDKERRAQRSIERFFEQNQIVPSPWIEEKTRPVFQLPSTPKASEETEEKDQQATEVEQKRESPKTKKQEVAVQTMLSLPVDFDVHKVLGDFIVDQNASQDKSGSPSSDLSSSSLRRKLFFHGDEGTPLSPVNKTTKDRKPSMEFAITPPVSPVKCKTPVPSRRSVDGSPSSAQFSSSPITSASASHGLRRCSTAPDLASSPTTMPVFGSARVQATPSSGAPSMPPDSPNMSPIRQPNVDGSYTDSSENCSNFSISQGARRKICRKPRVKSPEEQSVEDKRKMSNCQRRLMSEPCFGNDSNMEVEEDSQQITNDDKRASVSLPTYLQGGQLTNNHSIDASLSSLGYRSQQTKSIGPLNTSDDATSHTQGFLSQDTGYQSNSLQSTNCDPSLHTNLTNQFNSLPWLTHDNDTNDSHLDAKPAPVRQSAIFREIFHGPDEILAVPCIPANDKNANGIVLKAREVLSKCKDRNANDSVGMLSDDENESGATETDNPSHSWSPLLATPQRQKFQDLGVMSGDTGLRIKPSEVAERVLHRANEDFNHYFGEYVS